MPAVKHLILDVSVIIDLWLGVGSAEVTETLLDLAAEGKTRLWVAASSIPTLDYVARQALKQSGVPSEELGHLIARLMEDIFHLSGVLTNHGFEQKDIYRAARDGEDAQIAAAARSLKGVPVCVVCEDARFDTLGEVPVKTPIETLTWIHREIEDEFPETIPFIDLATQQAAIRPGIEQGIERVLRHGQYIMGPEIQELEEKLAEYVGVKHCITCASGTDALLMALMALDICPNDEVITVPYTWISTAEVIALLRAKPVFVDIRPETFNLDPDLLEAAITHRTKAIMPVGIYGQCADMTRINQIADKHGIPVIEDAAQCFGATHHGKKACNLSLIGCTSFFPSKPLGCYGDGGAIFTEDDALADKMCQIRIHGQKIKHQPPVIAPGNTSVYAQYTILSPNRDRLSQSLKEKGISSVAYYTAPLHLQGVFADLSHKAGDFPVAEQVAAQCLSLPMSPYLTMKEQEKVAGAIKG